MMMGARQRVGVDKETSDRRQCQLMLLCDSIITEMFW